MHSNVDSKDQNLDNNRSYLSVIVPVYNGRNFLAHCLDALFASDYDSFEVIVIDDCSTDGSGDVGLNKGARVILTEQRSGPAAARNLAAGMANGDVLIFVDADVVVHEDTLGKFARRFQTQPEIAAVFGSYDDEPAERNFLSQYKNLQHHYVHQNSSPRAFTFWSGLGGMRRDIFVGSGGFNSSLFAKPSIEDIELGFRIRSAGHQIILDREIQAKHLKKWDVKNLLETEIFGRALPWSRLTLERRGMTNDMNLKTADRVSAALVALILFSLPLVIWWPALAVVGVISLSAIAVLNRQILRFFHRKRGIGFAFLAFPWLVLYFFYSGTVFGCCWFSFYLKRALGMRQTRSMGESR